MREPFFAPDGGWKLLAALLLFTPSSAFAQTTGNELHAICNSQSPEEVAYCFGHITGIAQAMPFGASIAVYSMGVSKAAEANSLYEAMSGYCLDENVDNGQVIDVVRKYMNEHPEDRHNSARWVVLHAMQSAFPASNGC